MQPTAPQTPVQKLSSLPTSSSSTANPLTQSSMSGNPYYDQAVQMLSPIINAQTQPLQQQQDLLPSLYGQKQAALQNQITNTNNLYGNLQKQVQDQAGAQTTFLKQQNTTQLGQQRANEAANGIASTSGVEQSQEANINNNLAQTLYQLDTQTNDKTTELGLRQKSDVDALTAQLNELPNQQAQQALQIGAQIAAINGDGAKQAMSYATSMMQMAAENAYRMAQLNLQQGQLNLGFAQLQEAQQYHDAQIGLADAKLKNDQMQIYGYTVMPNGQVVVGDQSGLQDPYAKPGVYHPGQLSIQEEQAKNSGTHVVNSGNGVYAVNPSQGTANKIGTKGGISGFLQGLLGGGITPTNPTGNGGWY